MPHDSDEKSYVIESYIVAGFGAVISNYPADQVRNMNKRRDFLEIFSEEFGRDLPELALDLALDLMADLQLVDLNDDEFVGTYITTQKTAFLSRFKEIAQYLHGSPIAIVAKAGRPWIEEVFANEMFWDRVQERLSDQQSDESREIEENFEIPASDRTVSLVHNSAERIEIEQGLNEISDTLRTSNEVAEVLGDDRERISAEVEGVKAVLKSERVRLGYIRDSVLKVLGELSKKLKDNAIQLVVDRLLILFEKILDHYL
ncbi:hypothetical protein [Stakelama pacifica]|uniref:Uncharacterized protein n=1 Tax=Stakelama pacifica TaxID=517720 RepID=A0A4R6FXJ3_9SPHN|nr:hypothetical protein [Stakelama pacifica]TDN86642.1 hypothetical protein EV664_101216 [Stakelama pacifica]GGO90251.1 hypothetical protein GCM10011329_02120 [Stakelama pacifica]